MVKIELIVRTVERYRVVRNLTPPLLKMREFAETQFPGSFNITHLIEPSVGCANSQCSSMTECHAKNNRFFEVFGGKNWGAEAFVLEEAGAQYSEDFDAAFGRWRMGFFMAGYCEPFPPSQEIQRATKDILNVMIKNPKKRPAGLRFQTQSPCVIEDAYLLNQFRQLNEMLLFCIGISAPGEAAREMLRVAEKLIDMGLEVQLCVSPAKIRDAKKFVREIALVNPSSILYEPTHKSWTRSESKFTLHNHLAIGQFRDYLRREGYKGPIEDMRTTFTLLTPEEYLN